MPCREKEAKELKAGDLLFLNGATLPVESATNNSTDDFVTIVCVADRASYRVRGDSTVTVCDPPPAFANNVAAELAAREHPVTPAAAAVQAMPTPLLILFAGAALGLGWIALKRGA